MGCKEIKICQRLNSCLSLGGIPYYMCKYIPMVVNPQLISILILLIVSQNRTVRRQDLPPVNPVGKTVQTGVKIDIDDDGSVYIATPDEAAAAKARRIIEGIAKDIEVGEVYTGKVVRMMNFGVFVELLPGKDGMVHISKLAKGRVEKCEDVVKIGDELEVKVAEIDSQGRINLIRNDIEYDNTEMPRRSAPGQRPPRRDANRR